MSLDMVIYDVTRWLTSLDNIDPATLSIQEQIAIEKNKIIEALKDLINDCKVANKNFPNERIEIQIQKLEEIYRKYTKFTKE